MEVTDEMIKAFGRAWSKAEGAENVLNCYEHNMGDCPYHKTPGVRRRAGLKAVLEIMDGQTPEQKRDRAAQLLREANEQEGYDVQ